MLFWESDFVPGRPWTEVFVPGQRDAGTRIFFVPGQRDNGMSRPGLSRDVPSLGNTSLDYLMDHLGRATHAQTVHFISAPDQPEGNQI